MRERARIVVGADGLRSRIAPEVGAPEYGGEPTLSCSYRSYWSGVPVDGMESWVREGQSVLAMPTNDGLTWVSVGMPIERFDDFRRDVEGSYMAALAIAPGLAERLRGGRREERILGTGSLPTYFRRPYGPGWALVGDAGYHKDPAAGQGITDAFRDAELLSEAIHRGFSGEVELQSALARYERQRNEAARERHELAQHLARYEEPSASSARLVPRFGRGEGDDVGFEP